MAGLIKGQILKHLSKFVKNLSSNQINLSAIKGEGDLTNLELNEVVLTELLELPAWIRLTKASCNKASIRIQWTKLKTVPIQLQLDEIRVSLETCEELRSGDTNHKLSLSQTNNGAYGFTDKVVDGITVSVNLVYVTLSSLAFTASFQMSRILLESRTPAWQKANLQMTRLKDVDNGEVLIFKEISWQTVRIEAMSTVNKDLTPLRLITNQARCRITIKKRMSDCAILGCRLVLILDDLLWVLTDDQLKAALHFMDSISGLVKKATTTTQKAKAERKLENQGVKVNIPKTRSSSATNGATKTFQKYDVVETSYHFYSDRIDLHFCDDPGGGRSSHPSLDQGGAFQVSLSKLQIDYYPYHLARGDRKHWVRYTESPHKSWLHSNLASFDTRLLDVLLSGRNHMPLSRVGKSPAAPGGNHLSRAEPEDEALRDLVVNQLSRMMTENFVVRLFDVSVWCVATSTSPSASGTRLQELVKGDHSRLHLPEDLPLLHLEFTSFYYPGDLDFPLPPPILMVHMNPVTVWLDVLTLIWINAFILNLQKSVETLQASLDIEQSESFYADVKLEMLMPRVICGSRMKHNIEPDQKPSSLQIQASKISLANYRSLETGSRADLATVLEMFQQSPLFFGADFPSKPQDVAVVCQKFVSHATGTDAVREAPTSNMSFKKDLLWTDARDMWYVLVDSLWAEFIIPSCLTRPVPLIDAIPLAAWVYSKPQEKKQKKKRPACDRNEGRPHRKLLKEYYSDDSDTKQQDAEKSVHVLAHTTRLVSVQLDHHQLIFLLRLAESLSELSAFLSADTSNIEPLDSVIAVGAVLPQVDVSLIFPTSTEPPVYPPKELSLPPQLRKCKTPSPVHSSKNIVSSMEKLTVLSVETNTDRATLVEAENGAHTEIQSGGVKIQPVIDQSDPLSSFNLSSQEYSQVSVSRMTTPTTSSRATPAGTPSHTPGPPPTLKLSLAPSLSNELASSRGETVNHRVVDGVSYRVESSSSQRNRGITSSFNSLMDSMGFTGGNKDFAGTRSPEADFDTISVRSDESGESNWDQDGYVVLGGEEDLSDVLFSIQKDDRAVSPAELAEEVCEASEYLDIRLKTPTPEMQEMEDKEVKILTLHLGRIQFAQLSGASKPSTAESSEGDVSSILVRVGSLAVDPVIKQSWKFFQHKFCQSGKGWSDSTLCPLDSSCIKLRLESRSPLHPHLALQDLPEDLSISIAERISRISDGLLELHGQGLKLSLLSSTLNSLAGWSQDEILPTPLPLSLLLQDIRLNIEDDAPPPPGVPVPPPILVNIPTLRLHRDKNGELKISNSDVISCNDVIQAPSSAGQVKSELERQLDLARTEVLLLRQQLAEQQLQQEKRKEETKAVQVQLDNSRQQVSDMMLERDSLLSTLNYLQEELLKAGKK